MNKAITDGFALAPPPFSGGLDVWSSEDGTPGSPTYRDDADAACIVDDPDFGPCLALTKTGSVQSLRYTGETPILPGCYLRVSARIKAVSGELPSVRIAAWAGGAGGTHAKGLCEVGPSVALPAWNAVVEVSAIVGTGLRTGVDMVWGRAAVYGHFGIDLTGPSGAVVRIEDLQIEDVTGAFHRALMDWVDVRDFGAVGDGETDDQPAFAAADRAARGRSVLISEGTYFLGDNQTFSSPVRCEGTVVMGPEHGLFLSQNFDFPAYASAFADDGLGFRKALQALLGSDSHRVLDLGGRTIEISGPIDLAELVGQGPHKTPKTLRNGRIHCIGGPGWATVTVTREGRYASSSPLELSIEGDVAGIPVGAVVEAAGVGREVYVTAVDPEAGTVHLSQPFWGASARQGYTFRRFQYALDLVALNEFSRFTLDAIDFECSGEASGVLLPPAGGKITFRNCRLTGLGSRGITSVGKGCRDLMLEGCHFLSSEDSRNATERLSVGVNVNSDRARIRNNRFQGFGTAMIFHGQDHRISGNHLTQGDRVAQGPRLAGLVLTKPGVNSVILDNRIDNASIEWTNEHDADPDFASGASFGGLAISANIFTCRDVAPWFSWLVVKPFGEGHFLQGLSVTGNVFTANDGMIMRVEKVASAIADLDHSLARNITFSSNVFKNIKQNTINPVTLEFNQSVHSATWQLDVSGYLPFGGWARETTSVVTEGPVLSAVATPVFAMPYASNVDGAACNLVRLTWPEPVSGRVHVTVRTDRPI